MDKNSTVPSQYGVIPAGSPSKTPQFFFSRFPKFFLFVSRNRFHIYIIHTSYSIKETMLYNSVQGRFIRLKIKNFMQKVAHWLLIIGGLNWLLVGLLGWDIGNLFGGQDAIISRIIYVLVGLSALMALKPKSAAPAAPQM